MRVWGRGEREGGGVREEGELFYRPFVAPGNGKKDFFFF